jgi:hypothetical protein
LGFTLIPSGKEVILTQRKVTLPFSVRIHFAWMGISKRHTFYLLPDQSEQVILGKDFLSEAETDISMSRGGWFDDKNPQVLIPFDNWAASTDSCHKIATHEQWVNEVYHDIKGPEKAKEDIHRVVNQFAKDGLFTKKPGTVKDVEHTINTGNHPPHRDKVHPMSAHKTRLLDEQIQKLLEVDVIEECESPWRCNPVIIEKKSKKGPQIIASV